MGRAVASHERKRCGLPCLRQGGNMKGKAQSGDLPSEHKAHTSHTAQATTPPTLPPHADTTL